MASCKICGKHEPVMQCVCAECADVALVKYGKWNRTDDDYDSLTTIQCSVCKEEFCFETYDDLSLLNYHYCPNCGAKMDGEEQP